MFFLFFFLFHIQGVRRGLILFGQKQNKNRLSSAFGRGRKHSLENKKPWHLFLSILVSLIPSSTPSSIITIVTHQSLFIPLMGANEGNRLWQQTFFLHPRLCFGVFLLFLRDTIEVHMIPYIRGGENTPSKTIVRLFTTLRQRGVYCVVAYLGTFLPT